MDKGFEFGVHYGPYDKVTIERMYDARFAGMPLSFFLLDKRKTDTHCHFCASLLASIIPGAKRVEGKVAVLDGCEHSWVEIDGFVYDTSKTSMWLKDAYYENVLVLSTKVISDEEVRNDVEVFFNDKGFLECQVAWIRDLEDNILFLPYKFYLREHIERFKEEIGYDSLDINEDSVAKSMEDVRGIYKKIEQFKKDNPVYYKRNN